jgi:hypothetical protein
MLVYGIALQSFMNWMGRWPLTERGLFVYLAMLVPMVNLEEDVVALIATVVQNLMVVYVTSRVIYGPISLRRAVVHNKLAGS